MSKKQTVQLKYILRDDKPDTSFTLAIKREQAKRHVKRLLRRSGDIFWNYIDEQQKLYDLEKFDRKHGSSLKTEYLQAKRDKAIAGMRSQYMPVETAVGRNKYGQFSNTH